MPWLSIEEQNADEQNADGRMLTYTAAVREALKQAMKLDDSVFIMGQGVNDKVGIFGITTDLYKEYGEKRVWETPLSENAMCGVAVGAALSGFRPFYCHIRQDFLMLTMDQIVNHASKMSYMSGGKCSVPMVIWACTGKGWGSGAQHSQALQGIFMHVPGLKIIMPSTPYDAKGLTIAAIADNNPVLILEHREVFGTIGHVPEEVYKLPIGKGVIRKEGTDITIVGISQMVLEAVKAAEELEENGIHAEVIDLRSIKPYDKEIIVNSVRKTGRLIIADTGWKTGGVASTIASDIYEEIFRILVCPIGIIALPDLPTPAGYSQEEVYYKNKKDIKSMAIAMLKR